MALDIGPSLSVQSSPTLSSFPYHAPSRTSLQHASHHGSSSPLASSSPIPCPPGEELCWQGSKDQENVGNEEEISALDPRRFTPNLHASLVSEILSLRRDVESKTALIGNLEEDLLQSQTTNAKLNQTMQSQAAEVRSAKKQMHLLESGTLSTLGELAKERDEALEHSSDIRKRFETCKNTLRLQDSEVQRIHELWDQDKRTWEIDKRNMDRKVHVADNRLRTVLAELAAAHVSAPQSPLAIHEVDEGMRETWFTKSSDTNSVRSNSVKGRSRLSGLSIYNQEANDLSNFRSSVFGGFNGLGGTRFQGLSLAEELELDQDEEENIEGYLLEGGLISPGALPEEVQMKPRRLSIQQQTQDGKARKILGLGESHGKVSLESNAVEQHQEEANEKHDHPILKPATQYKDAGTQYSPPAISKPPAPDAVLPADRTLEQTEPVANQRRKRVSVLSASSEQTQSTKSAHSTVLPMVSAGCQTVEPLSPPQTPINTDVPSAASSLYGLEMRSSATQTDPDDDRSRVAAGTRDGLSMTVPIIAIHPPGSRPSSSHNSVVLPPRTRNAACQASLERPVRSISVQTENDSWDPRALQTLARLSLSYVPPKPSARSHELGRESPKKPNPRRRSTRRNPHRSSQFEHVSARVRGSGGRPTAAYPGDNDSGPLNKNQPLHLRRPVRTDSLFAGFDSVSEHNHPELTEIDFSDDDFSIAPPIRKTLSKVQNSWKLVPCAKNHEPVSLEPDNEEPAHIEIAGDAPEDVAHDRSTPTRMPGLTRDAGTHRPTKPPGTLAKSKEPNIRRAALVSSGAAVHTSRARSPSAPSGPTKESTALPPPFPVPTRLSSRKIPLSASDGARSPTPYSSGFFAGSHQRDHARPPSKSVILRKVQSATAVPRFARTHRRRSLSRSPPLSHPTLATDSPRLPWLPQHHVTTSDARTAPSENDVLFPSNSISPVIEDPVDSSTNPVSVVDAIAQTMVGEWMWKYVRRRKSFGITESAQVEFEVERGQGENSSGSGVRHKRWVWLAPYERAIMWSSKQPTSGPALLGKSGRKRKHSIIPW